VSGGSFPRLIDQLGRKIIDDMQGVFPCMANAFYQKKVSKVGSYSEWVKVYENKFKVEKPKLFFSELERVVTDSDYHTKTGRHYEERPGMVNFSVVGRNATMSERKEYEVYDKEHSEREQIAAKLSKKYKKLDFVIGGAVSLDIFNKGNDKSQVIHKHFKDAIKDHRIIFVGDRISFPGNDYSIAEELKRHSNGASYEVESWNDTEKLLKTEPFA
jgi:phosphomannomutase